MQKQKNISKSKKALNFDLNDYLFKKNYPSKNYKKGWSDIKSFLENQGFIHRQYSGYVSYDAMHMIDVIQIITKMSLSLIWLKKCVQQFDVTLVGDEYSLIDYIQDSKLKELS